MDVLASGARTRTRAPIRPVARATFLALWLTLAGCAEAPDEAAYEAPYDEGADAVAVVEAAMAEARESGKLVLLNFGANWCPDCRAFARATADPELAAIIADRFVTAKIDVGNWDRNPDVVDEWDNPIGEGIPALVVASPDGERLFATQRGQVSSASRMSRDDLAEFFRLLAEVADSAQVADAGR